MTLGVQLMMLHTKHKYYADVQFETQGCKQLFSTNRSFASPGTSFDLSRK